MIEFPMPSLILSLLALAFAAPAQTVAPASEIIPAAARKAAPDFHLRDVNGKPLTLSQFKGKVVLLDFWAVNCGGCKLELPWYVEFDHKYHARGLQLVGLDMYGESPGLIRAFMAKHDMTYPVAVGTDVLGGRYGLKEMPLTLLIDRRGRIALAHSGVVERVAFERDLNALLDR